MKAGRFLIGLMMVTGVMATGSFGLMEPVDLSIGALSFVSPGGAAFGEALNNGVISDYDGRWALDARIDEIVGRFNALPRVVRSSSTGAVGGLTVGDALATAESLAPRGEGKTERDGKVEALRVALTAASLPTGTEGNTDGDGLLPSIIDGSVYDAGGIDGSVYGGRGRHSAPLVSGGQVTESGFGDDSGVTSRAGSVGSALRNSGESVERAGSVVTAWATAESLPTRREGNREGDGVVFLTVVATPILTALPLPRATATVVTDWAGDDQTGDKATATVVRVTPSATWTAAPTWTAWPTRVPVTVVSPLLVPTATNVATVPVTVVSPVVRPSRTHIPPGQFKKTPTGNP